MSKSKTVTEPTLLDLLAVKQGKAPKLSAGAEGEITYQVALSADKKLIYIALQDSGSQGYFSHEWINADDILESLEALRQRAEAFASKVLQPVFVGRSSNNAPFLAAVLLAEKLLGRDEKHETKLRVIGDGAAWRKGIAGLKGKLIQVRLDGKPIISAAPEKHPQEDNSATSSTQEQNEDAQHAADSSE